MDIVNLVNKDFEEQEKKNREKYGSRDDDHIARCFKKSTQIGTIWCLENVIKYLTRFESSSGKSANPMDLLKSVDYIFRCYEANKMAGVFDNKKEIIDEVKHKGSSLGKTTLFLPNGIHIVLEDQPKAFQLGFLQYPEGVYDDSDNEGYKLYLEGLKLAKFYDDEQKEKSFTQKEFESNTSGKDMGEERNGKDRLKEAFREIISDQHSGMIPYQQGVNDFNNGGVQMEDPLKHFGNKIDTIEYLEGFDDAKRKYKENNKNSEILTLEKVKSKVKENSVNEKFGDSYEEKESVKDIGYEPYPHFDEETEEFQKGYKDYPKRKFGSYLNSQKEKQYNKGFELAKAHNTTLP